LNIFIVSNSSVQNVRVSVSSSRHGDELGKSVQTEFCFPSPVTTTTKNSNDESYSSMISNFVSENLVKTSKLDDEETFDRRPLLDLISELNRRHTLNQSPTIHSHDTDQSSQNRTISPIPTDILPPKSLSPFRPVIVHRKHQVILYIN
jgi:hypothetical protein